MTNERGGGGEGKASGDFNSLNTKEAFQMSHTVEGGRQEGTKQPTLPQSLPLDKKTNLKRLISELTRGLGQQLAS